jgi:hypothetical protein
VLGAGVLVETFVGCGAIVTVGVALGVAVAVLAATTRFTAYVVDCQSFANAGAPLASAGCPFTRKIAISPFRIPANVCPPTVSSP